MSQIPEKYYLVIKMQEAYIKLCEISMKTLESMENEINSDEMINLKDQMGKLVIENLNLFQDKGFIQNIQRDKVMNQDKKNSIEVKFGNNAHISGDFIVAKSIENSFNKAANSNLETELKDLLKELSIEVGKMMEHLSQEDATDVAEDLDTLIEKTTCEKPKRKWWSVSIDGLTKAAEKLGKIGAPVVELLGKIVPHLIKISA